MTFITVCAWCGEVLKYEVDGKPTQTSHGICQACACKDLWKPDPKYPVKDWQHEVAADDTRLGYLDWAEHQREASEDEKERANL